MEKNIGNVERVIRLVLGIALLSLVFVGPQTPWGWLGLVLIGTSAISFCPIWRIFKINTCKIPAAK